MVANFVDIQRIIKELDEQHCDRKCGNPGAMDLSLERHKLPKFTQGERVL